METVNYKKELLRNHTLFDLELSRPYLTPEGRSMQHVHNIMTSPESDVTISVMS